MNSRSAARELGGLKSHLDSDKGCGYVEVTCTKKGCVERVSRKDLQTHLQEKCYYRPYQCEYCGHKDIYIHSHHWRAREQDTHTDV